LGVLKHAIPGWLDGVKSVKGIWNVRAVVRAILDGGEGFEEDIASAMEDLWERKVEQVWKGRLEGLIRIAEEKVRKAGFEVRQMVEGSGRLFVSLQCFAEHRRSISGVIHVLRAVIPSASYFGFHSYAGAVQ
jgi:hypothetical protein